MSSRPASKADWLTRTYFPGAFAVGSRRCLEGRVIPDREARKGSLRHFLAQHGDGLQVVLRPPSAAAMSASVWPVALAIVALPKPACSAAWVCWMLARPCTTDQANIAS